MPMTEVELKNWVKGLDIPEAEQAGIINSFSKPEVIKKLESSILAQNDYSKKMDELKSEKDRLEADYQKRLKTEDSFRAGLTEWKTTAEKEYADKLKAATDESLAKLAAARDKIKSVADRYGVPEDEIKDLLSVQAPEKRVEVARDPETGKFVTLENFQKESNAFAKLPAIMVGLDREYYRLFGNDAPPVNWEKIIESATANRRSVSTEFESTFKMEDKRKEIADAARKKELETAREEARTQERSKILAEHPELANRTVNRERPGSPILTEARRQAATGKPPEHTTGGPRSAVEAAVAAFSSGKYKDGVEHAA